MTILSFTLSLKTNIIFFYSFIDQLCLYLFYNSTFAISWKRLKKSSRNPFIAYFFINHSIYPEFKKIKVRNEELPSHIRLDIKEFEMDPEIREEFEKQKQEQIDFIHKEMAWESEKQTIALQKLEKRFKHQIGAV